MHSHTLHIGQKTCPQAKIYFSAALVLLYYYGHLQVFSLGLLLVVNFISHNTSWLILTTINTAFFYVLASSGYSPQQIAYAKVGYCLPPTHIMVLP